MREPYGMGADEVAGLRRLGGYAELKTQILKIKGSWQEVVDDCRATVGKGELGKEPSEAFKRGILIAEHSPIRALCVRWKWEGIKNWVATHWVRHIWSCFVQTQRSDRTGIPRDKLPQDAPVNFRGEANAQHLIDTWRKRLCMQAAPETRQYAEDFKQTLHEREPELAGVLVPNCVYRCGCPEMGRKCKAWQAFCEWGLERYSVHPQMMCIQERYEVYNEYFAEKRRAAE